MPRTRWQQGMLWLCAIMALMLTVAVIAYALFAPALIQSIYEQRSWPALNRLAHPERHPLEHYDQIGRVLFTRGVIFCVIALLAVLAIAFRKPLSRFFRDFVRTPDWALNLAVFRVAAFAALLFALERERHVIVNSCRLPDELRVAPIGLAGLLSMVTFNEEVAVGLFWIARLACVAGILGLFSRTSAAVACLLAVYLLGIPQCFGKVNHYHHVIWFTALLAVSPCGDALAFDALLKKRRCSEPAAAYGAPLRFAWLTMGVIYFFPGFWKLFQGGIDWGLSENVRNTMYEKWQQMPDWQPFIPVDQYPPLCVLVGLGTIFFELSFIVLVLISPRTRLLAAIIGMAFHTGTYLFMRIQFMTLQAAYVSLIDWHGLLMWLSGRKAGADEGQQTAEMPDLSPGRPVLVVGWTLVAVNIVFGVFTIELGWPFACYPTFRYLVTPEMERVEFVMGNPSGTSEVLDQAPMLKQLGSARWFAMTAILRHERDVAVRQRKLQVLWTFLEQQNLAPSGVNIVSVYVVRTDFSAGPTNAPQRRELLFHHAPNNR